MKQKKEKKKILVLFPWGIPHLRIFDSSAKDMKCFSYDVITAKYSIKKWKNMLTKIFHVYFLYIWTAIKAFYRIKTNNYSLIFSWSPNPALILAFFNRLFLVKCPPIVCMMFIIPTNKSKFLTKLRFALTNFSLKGIHSAICFSTNEINYYKNVFSKHKDKFLFIPLGRISSDLRPNDGDTSNGRAKDYIFSGGTSNRDYKTLIEAVRQTVVHLIIIGKGFNFNGNVGKISPNIEILEEVYGQDFAQMMYKSKIVVIPLLNPNISSGQLVLLQAMELGKPIIATKAAGIVDYVIPDHNCVLVSPQNSKELQCRILQLLYDPDKLKMLGENARESYLNNFTFERFIKRVISFLFDCIQSNGKN